MKELTDGSAEAARERSKVYGFLASVFSREPTEAFLKGLREPRFQVALRDAGVALGEDILNRPAGELVDELAVEYTRLFIGPGKHISPHESVYREENGGTLWGEETGRVVGLIRDAGLDFKEDFTGLPDHIGVELDFMGEMARREAEALEIGDADIVGHCRAAQDEMLEGHLLRWVPAFCGKVAEQSRSSLYLETAKLTEAFIRSEGETRAS